jgi:hypothetical protein
MTAEDMYQALSLDEQTRNLKSMRYFSSAFRAWCAYGVSIRADGRWPLLDHGATRSSTHR